MKILFLAIGLIGLLGIGWPLMAAVAGGDENEATRMVDATSRTQEKAHDISETYNDIIPPASPYAGAAQPSEPDDRPYQEPDESAPPPAGGFQQAAPSSQGGASVAQSAAPGEVEQVEVELDKTPHPVRDAMDFLARVDAEFGPSHTEYTMAVAQLKRAWAPRYERAIDEYDRFEERVNHADDMAYEYLELQQRLTASIRDRDLKAKHQMRDVQEQVMVLDWLNQAKTVLAQARAIRMDLDDMNVSITKLELSAQFAAVYEGFVEMPFAITLLNQELERFELESELIYKTLSPQAEK